MIENSTNKSSFYSNFESKQHIISFWLISVFIFIIGGIITISVQHSESYISFTATNSANFPPATLIWLTSVMLTCVILCIVLYQKIRSYFKFYLWKNHPIFIFISLILGFWIWLGGVSLIFSGWILYKQTYSPELCNPNIPGFLEEHWINLNLLTSDINWQNIQLDINCCGCFSNNISIDDSATSLKCHNGITPCGPLILDHINSTCLFSSILVTLIFCFFIFPLIYLFYKSRKYSNPS